MTATTARAPYTAATPKNQRDRLAALKSYGILDTPVEAAFDDITRIASIICRTPIAVVNLIDESRQWFKSEIGLGMREMPLDASFCAHAILEPGLMEVPDTLDDPRFSCNPLVTGAPNLRFYAGSLLLTADGHALGTVCVLDYKPRRLSGSQREALQALSRQVMAQLELRRTLTELDRAMRYRAQLMAIAGHDLRQPLQVMSMSLGILEKKLVDGEHKGILARAERALSDLSDDLLHLADSSRLDHPDEILHRSFPIAELIARVQDTWKLHAEHKGLRLRVAPCKLWVKSDPAILSTIIGNFVGNAIKYTSKGGILIGCRRRAGQLSVEVLDTGCGIASDKLKDVFEPFTQLDASREGLGLGLSIVLKSAQILDHKLDLTSKPGSGSRFAITVPIGTPVPTAYRPGS